MGTQLLKGTASFLFASWTFQIPLKDPAKVACRQAGPTFTVSNDFIAQKLSEALAQQLILLLIVFFFVEYLRILNLSNLGFQEGNKQRSTHLFEGKKQMPFSRFLKKVGE